MLFDLLTVFLAPSLVDFSFLHDFYRHEVATTWSAAHKRAALVLFLRVLADAGVTMELKVQALQLLVTPMLAATFADPAKVVMSEWARGIESWGARAHRE